MVASNAAGYEIGIDGYSTYRLSVELTDLAENLHTVKGREGVNMSFPPAWQIPDPLGVNYGGAFSYQTDIESKSAFDSWITLGITGGDVYGELRVEGFGDGSGWVKFGSCLTTNPGCLEELDGAGWTLEEFGSALVLNDNTTIAYLNPDDSPVGDGGNRTIVLAQLTLPGDNSAGNYWEAQVHLRGKPTSDGNRVVATYDLQWEQDVLFQIGVPAPYIPPPEPAPVPYPEPEPEPWFFAWDPVRLYPREYEIHSPAFAADRARTLEVERDRMCAPMT
eukprot:COSAG05_NODE_7309_length_829_cov_1.257534_1_plen_276_part_11